MSLYGQDPELRLLSRILPSLPNTTVVDAGAELGEVTAALRAAGAEHAYAVEPAPDNAAQLRTRFTGDDAVTVLQLALGREDGVARLHLASAPDGTALTFAHTLLDLDARDEVAWTDAVDVEVRSLGSLVAAGAIPERVGIVKVDTEGLDFDVVAGLGALDADVIVVEHWESLPRSLGRCPWTFAELSALLEPRGFHSFAFLVHRGELRILQWGDARVPDGAMGNLFFLHDRIAAAALPALLEEASALARQAADLADERTAAAADRLEVIAGLERELEVQSNAAHERLLLIEQLRFGDPADD